MTVGPRFFFLRSHTHTHCSRMGWDGMGGLVCVWYSQLWVEDMQVAHIVCVVGWTEPRQHQQQQSLHNDPSLPLYPSLLLSLSLSGKSADFPPLCSSPQLPARSDRSPPSPHPPSLSFSSLLRYKDVPFPPSLSSSPPWQPFFFPSFFPPLLSLILSHHHSRVTASETDGEESSEKEKKKKQQERQLCWRRKKRGMRFKKKKRIRRGDRSLVHSQDAMAV